MKTTILRDHGDGPHDAEETRIRALFARAVDLPETEWEPFLLRECPDDPGLRDEVLRLLGAWLAAGAERFLDWSTNSEAAADPGLFGKYRVFRRLSDAHTGRAVAFLAFDPDTRRHVVLGCDHDGGGLETTAKDPTEGGEPASVAAT